MSINFFSVRRKKIGEIGYIMFAASLIFVVSLFLSHAGYGTLLAPASYLKIYASCMKNPYQNEFKLYNKTI